MEVTTRAANVEWDGSAGAADRNADMPASVGRQRLVLARLGRRQGI